MAAGVLLVREAGGIVTTMDGAPLPRRGDVARLAGNPTMHAWLLRDPDAATSSPRRPDASHALALSTALQ